MVFGNHALDALDRRNRRPHAGFGIEAVGAATPAGVAGILAGVKIRIRRPVRRRDVFIGPGHFHAAFAGHRGRFRGGGRHHRIRPQQVSFNLQIHLFDVRRRRIVAAIQPHRHARMVPQPIHLVAQRGLCDLEVLILPASPVLPEIAAAPSCHHQDALLVGHLVKFLGLEFAFQPDCVQSHVAHIAELIGEPLRGLAHHHVGRPAAAANQDVLAVDLEPAFQAIRRLLGDFGGDLANAEFRTGEIGKLSVHLERKTQIVQVRRPHLRRPPQPRIAQVELWIPIRREHHVFRLSRRQFHGLGEFYVLGVSDPAFQRPFYRVIAGIFQLRGYRQVGCPGTGIAGGRIHFREHCRIPQRDRPAGR